MTVIFSLINMFYFNCNRVCGLLVNTLDFKKPHKKKSRDMKCGGYLWNGVQISCNGDIAWSPRFPN